MRVGGGCAGALAVGTAGRASCVTGGRVILIVPLLTRVPVFVLAVAPLLCLWWCTHGLPPFPPVHLPSPALFPPPPPVSPCRDGGQLDCLVRDENDEYGVIDFKTSSVSKSLSIYSRQLHAYAYALECPSDASELLPGRVSHMGLVVYEPTSFACDDEGVAAIAAAGAANGTAAADAAAAVPALPAYATPGDTVAADLRGRAVWVPVPRDDAAFGAFLGSVLDVLEQPEPPPPAPASWGGKGRLACTYCQYVEDVRAGGLAHSGHLPD